MPSLRGEIAATFALAWPIVLTNVAVNFMTTTDVMFLGRLSPEALAAGALGFNLYTPPFLFSLGVISAAAPLAAARIGADRRDFAGVRAVGQQALLSSLLLALPFWVLFWNAAPILKALGEPPDLADLAGRYMHGLQWALAPALLYIAARSLFSALDRVRAVLVAGLVAVAATPVQLCAGVRPFRPAGAPAPSAPAGDHLSQTLMFLMLVFL